jgi:TPR repeat protein
LAKAAGWYLRSAEQGYSSAQVKLGEMYAAGDGVPADESTALSWYRKAADQGDPDGEVGLGLLYAKEARPAQGPLTGVRFEDLMNGVFGRGRWRETGGYRTPARENELRAEGALTVPLGMRSSHSLGTPDAPGAYDVVVDGMTPERAALKLKSSGLDFKRLFPESTHGTQGPHLHVEPFLGRAATARYPGANTALVSTFAPESPLKTDVGAAAARAAARDQAITWLTRAADQGRSDAEFNLGLIYLNGDVARADVPLAVLWLGKAAGHGSVGAQVLLGKTLAKGEGVPRNLAEAHRWLSLAVSASDPSDTANLRSAQKLLREIDAEMTPADVSQVIADGNLSSASKPLGHP